jgi:hypothetical protein
MRLFYSEDEVSEVGISDFREIQPGMIFKRKKDNMFYKYLNDYRQDDITNKDRYGLYLSSFFGFVVRKKYLHNHFESTIDNDIIVYEENKDE